MRTISFPGLDYFLQDDTVEQYPYLKTFAEARLEPLVVLHTSGSTGIPKPVIMVHGTLSCIDAYRLIPSLGGREVAGPSWEGTRLFLAFPLFHAASMCSLLGLGIYCGVICVLPPSGVPLSASIVDQVHTAGNVQGSALPPSILVDLVREPSFQKNLWLLQYVIYAGGPLPKETGNVICSKTNLVTLTCDIFHESFLQNTKILHNEIIAIENCVMHFWYHDLHKQPSTSTSHCITAKIAAEDSDLCSPWMLATTTQEKYHNHRTKRKWNQEPRLPSSSR